MDGGIASLLVLADGRFPSGGHAYSGGVEAAVAAGRVQGAGDLRAFLAGRLHTTGAVAGALAAAGCGLAGDERAVDAGAWRALDAEADARITAPALRDSSRRQGRQVLRAGRAVWPGDVLDQLVDAVPTGAHHPVALGAVAAAGGLTGAEAALAATYDSVCGPAMAAVRLLGLDPYAVHSLVADLAPAMEVAAAQAARRSTGPLSELPALAAPLLDLSAESHVRAEVRFFAS
ncbi:MAG: urease accessory protein UreF [Actinomycetota bacterium]|nr:urease accessory protein UreF [Actinomycetota bacterium]